MSFRNFVPEIWSSKILTKLRASHVFGQAGVVNRDYEGEIRAFGDTVRINSVGEVTIFDYVANTDMAAPEELTDEQRTLIIDTQKAFNFQVDDVDKAQAKGVSGVLGQAFESAGYGLSEVVDSQLSGKMAAAALLGGAEDATAPLDLTAANIYQNLFIPARTALTRANVPFEGRFIALPPELVALALDSDRMVEAGSADVLNGLVGRCAGFNVLESNTVPELTDATAGDSYQVLATHAMATSFAEQIVSVEPYRMEKRFADAVKGLHVYGSKVLRPEIIYKQVAQPA